MRKITGVGAVALAAALWSLTAQSAPAPARHDTMLEQLIHETIDGRVRYEAFTPKLAAAVRPQMATARAELVAPGALKSVTFEKTDADGFEIYRTVFEKGALDWAFSVDAKGLIANAAFRPAGPT